MWRSSNSRLQLALQVFVFPHMALTLGPQSRHPAETPRRGKRVMEVEHNTMMQCTLTCHHVTHLHINRLTPRHWQRGQSFDLALAPRDINRLMWRGDQSFDLGVKVERYVRLDISRKDNAKGRLHVTLTFTANSLRPLAAHLPIEGSLAPPRHLPSPCPSPCRLPCPLADPFPLGAPCPVRATGRRHSPSRRRAIPPPGPRDGPSVDCALSDQRPIALVLKARLGLQAD